MKLKRIALFLCLLFLFVFCFESMDTRYNPLARYSYNKDLTPQQKELIIKYMSRDDIDYMIQAKLKPEQYMKYLTMEGFSVQNTLYYEKCKSIRNGKMKDIIAFVNTYKKHLKYKEIPSLLDAYSYTMLEEYYNGNYTYDKEAKLIVDPQYIHTRIKEDETIYKYIPKDLAVLDQSMIPIASVLSRETIKVKKEMVEPLLLMCKDLEKEMHEKYGGLILTSGYVNYASQRTLYEKALIKYGVDEVLYYEDYPGKSEHQLGYTITFTVSGLEEEEIKDSKQVQWLEEHAKEYGFVIRYPKGEENRTGKYYQPLTLRYIGNEILEEDFDFIAFLSGD